MFVYSSISLPEQWIVIARTFFHLYYYPICMAVMVFRMHSPCPRHREYINLFVFDAYFHCSRHCFSSSIFFSFSAFCVSVLLLLLFGLFSTPLRVFLQFFLLMLCVCFFCSFRYLSVCVSFTITTFRRTMIKWSSRNGGAEKQSTRTYSFLCTPFSLLYTANNTVYNTQWDNDVVSLNLQNKMKENHAMLDIHTKIDAFSIPCALCCATYVRAPTDSTWLSVARNTEQKRRHTTTTTTKSAPAKTNRIYESLHFSQMREKCADTSTIQAITPSIYSQ